MTQTELTIYRRRLEELLGRLRRDESRVMGEALQPAGGESGGGLSNVPVHLADLGTHAAEEDVNFSLAENEAGIIEQIDLALARIGQGTFGRCEGCGKDIPKERLEAVPYTRYCVGCAEKQS
jgi:RNA polymerase-binding transcription factor DksA